MVDLLEKSDKIMKAIKPFVVKATVNVTAERLNDLLTNAFEGGSAYWAQVEKEKLAKGVKREDFAFPTTEIPFAEGCALIMGEVEKDPDLCGKRLDRASMQKGLQIMHDEYPEHFNNFITENDDAETGDVFLQCCLYGELVFG